MEVKCDYCGGMMDDRQDNCPHCGASNVHIKRMADNTPSTIEELKIWYTQRNLPPYETTRFFIGIDYKEPRAFGIYKEGNEFIVYKNKDDGSRAIRYRGTDEGYAVNELYLKLKSEILLRKGKQISSKSADGQSTNKNNIGKWLIMAFVGFVAVSAIIDLFFSPKPTYYQYKDSVYCEYDGDYYSYNSYDYYPISVNSVPSEIIENGPDYEFDSSDVNWNSSMDFTSSQYYEDNFSSDSDSDWSSSDSWDSGDSDWGSDW